MKGKGLSPVVATTLLVLLVIIIGVIIFLWARGFLFEQIEKFGDPVSQSCSDVVFDAEIVGDSSSGRSELLITNRGNIDIFQFDVKMVKGGSSEITRFKSRVSSKSATKGFVTLRMGDSGLVVPDEVVLYPALVGSSGVENKVFTCSDQGLRLLLS